MQETEKIWMNGELVDWADAKVHVGVHGLHYGTGVFEGIRCYDTPKGPAVFRLADHMQPPARLGAAAVHGHPVLGRGAARGHARARHERAGVELHPPDRVLRLRRARRLDRGNPVETVIMNWPWGAYLGEGSLDNGHHDEDLLLEARRPERDPARLEGDGRLSQLDARDDRGAARRLRRGDPAHRRRLHRRRPRREHLRGQERRHPHAAALDLDPAGHHAGLGDHDRARPRVRRRGDAADPPRPRSRRRGVHDGHRRRGDARARGRRHRDRRRRRSRARFRRRTSRPSMGSTTGGARGSTSWTPRGRERQQGRDLGRPPDRALGTLARRARGGARDRGAAVGEALARPVDRPLRGAVRRGRRRAVRGGRLERHRRPAPALRRGRASARATR